MNTTTKIAASTAVAVILTVVACGQPPEPELSIYEAAVASPARPDSDRERDANRKPAAVLEFIGVKEGMMVLDLFTGGGYYAELLSTVVGDQGKVVAQTNQAYIDFVGAEFNERFGGGKLPNVEVLKAENNQLALDAEAYDVIMLVLSFHDLYHVDPENGWEQIDGIAFLDELRKGLKPGGIVAIIDHHAAAGSLPETGDTLHRIDPELVIANMEAAGFDLEAQSDLLRNPEDDLSKSAFDPEVRGKTDRFVMRFMKPE